VRPTSSAPTLSTPLVATLTAAAAGRPPSLAATVIAPQSCCVAAMPAQCGSIQRSAPTRTPFLERRILPIRRVWRHVCISLESRLNGPKAPKFPAARTSRLEFRGADRSPEGALPVLFLIPHGNGTLFHFFSQGCRCRWGSQSALLWRLSWMLAQAASVASRYAFVRGSRGVRRRWRGRCAPGRLRRG